MRDAQELVYVALGGAGEIGMNCYLYGFGPAHDRQWLMVDCGVTFGDTGATPGVDLILPDIDFIAAQRGRLLGVLVTHAHEDHVGALAHHWRRLRAPVFCTSFTAAVARRKMAEENAPEKTVTQVAPGEEIQLGAFSAAFVPMTHSVPEAMAVRIATPLGVVFHTGDFKFDPDPLIAAPIDEAALRRLGDDGVLCLTCDSTNVLEETGDAGSEASVRDGLSEIIAAAPGAVAATSFASNVARLRTIAEIAAAQGRSVVVAGRAMRRMIDTALETGAIPDFPAVISEAEAARAARNRLLYLVTGSQGEGRAAMARIAAGSHPTVSLGKGDTVIYSSRIIPGNEREVHKVYNRLSEMGVRVVDADMARIHVSGHANRAELQRLYALLRPRIAMPMHGEHRHLSAHAHLAPTWGAEHAVLAANGAMVRLARDGDSAAAPEIVDAVETGRMYIDGSTKIGALDGVIRARLRLARQGHAAIALVVDENGDLLDDPQVKVVGAPTDGDNWPAPLDEMIAEAVDAALERLSARDKLADGSIEEAAYNACRRTCDKRWGKKPETTVMLTRLDEADD